MDHSMGEFWNDEVMSDLCVYLGEEVVETTIPRNVIIDGQHFPAGSIYSITYKVFSFGPLENRPDRGPNKEGQTAMIYMKVFGSEKCSSPFIESDIAHLTTESIEPTLTPAV